MGIGLISLSVGSAAQTPELAPPIAPGQCRVETVVLGAAQDAGIPQIGNPKDPAWEDDREKRYATSIAVIDHGTNSRYLFDATPDMREQIQLLDTLYPRMGDNWLALNGIFLTHAHIGHYAGLLFLGRESASTRNLPLYLSDKFANFLRGNAPWDQLVKLKNVDLQPFMLKRPVILSDALSVAAYQIPHRNEYADTVAYIIRTPFKSLLFMPDIDSYDRMIGVAGMTIEQMLGLVDYAYVDGTFYDDGELVGRDMSEIPHPRVLESINRFKDLVARSGLNFRFIHYNHTNPIRYAGSEERAFVLSSGFHVAERGERVCLTP